MTKAEHEMMIIDYLFVLAQKTLCSGTIKIVSKVSPNFGCLFLRMGGMAVDCRDKYVLIIHQFFVNISQYYLDNKTFTFHLCPLAWNYKK